MPSSDAAIVGTKWPMLALVNACSADPPSILSAVVRPLRVTAIWPVWQAAQLMSSRCLVELLVVMLREADRKAVGVPARHAVDQEPVAPHDRGIGEFGSRPGHFQVLEPAVADVLQHGPLRRVVVGLPLRRFDAGAPALVGVNDAIDGVGRQHADTTIGLDDEVGHEQYGEGGEPAGDDRDRLEDGAECDRAKLMGQRRRRGGRDRPCAEPRLAAGRLGDPARAIDAADRPVIGQRELGDVDEPRLALGVGQQRPGLQRKPPHDVERRLRLGPLDAGVLDPERRVAGLAVDRHPRRLEQLDAEVEAGRDRIVVQVPRELVAQDVFPFADRQAGVVGRRNGGKLHRLVLPVHERDVAPVARLLIRAERAVLLPDPPARGLKKALEILERERQQRTQVPEEAVGPLDPHERRERVRVVDREGRGVIQRVVEPGRVRPHRAGRQVEGKGQRADVGLGVGLERGRGVCEADDCVVGSGFGKEPAPEARRQRRATGRLCDVEDLERRPGAHPLGVRAAAERPPLLPREPCLDGEDAGDDVGDVLLFRGQLALEVHAVVIQSRTAVSVQRRDPRW